MSYYIGIDPSINSTGVCVWNGLSDYKFYNIKSKLTKKEKNCDIPILEYIEYNKQESQDIHRNEVCKTMNFGMISSHINSIVSRYNDYPVHICMEGISYGSLKTKSVFDLAGLNYIIRYKLVLKPNTSLIIAPPSEIKKFVTGKGNSDKDQIVSCFLPLFPELKDIKKIDDIADAFYMSQYAKILENF